MRNTQQGFTLIELVVVIVILGILAATALPKFVDLSVDAGDSAAKGTAGAISSGSSINFAQFKLNGTGTSIVSGTTQCSAASAFLTGGAMPDTSLTWVAPTGVITCVSGVSSDCKVKHAKGTSTGFAAPIFCTS